MSELTEKIKNDEVLREYIADECRENSAEVRISDGIEDYCIVNPEKYFRAQSSGSTPSSVDYIITATCRKHFHDHNLIELKSASTTLRGEYANIYNKFEDTLDKFFFESFQEVYGSVEKSYFRLILVHNIKTKSELQFLAKLFMTPINRNNRNFYIRHHNSPHELKRC